jgi:hypothetical protein
MTGQQPRRNGPQSASANKLLAVLAVVWAVMAGYALYKKMDPQLVLGLAFLATISAAISSFAPRMIGKFSLSHKGLDFYLDTGRVSNSISNAERELRDKELIPLEEAVSEDD